MRLATCLLLVLGGGPSACDSDPGESADGGEPPVVLTGEWRSPIAELVPCASAGAIRSETVYAFTAIDEATDAGGVLIKIETNAQDVGVCMHTLTGMYSLDDSDLLTLDLANQEARYEDGSGASEGDDPAGILPSLQDFSASASGAVVLDGNQLSIGTRAYERVP